MTHKLVNTIANMFTTFAWLMINKKILIIINIIRVIISYSKILSINNNALYVGL